MIIEIGFSHHLVLRIRLLNILNSIKCTHIQDIIPTLKEEINYFGL